jgi:hypothetical protein
MYYGTMMKVNIPLMLRGSTLEGFNKYVYKARTKT